MVGNAGTVTGSSGTTNVAGGGSGGTPTLPEAGTNAGGAGAGGETAAGAGGTAQGGSGGESAGGTAGTGGAGMAYEGPFTCTEYIGAYLSMEWWNRGFEDKLDAEGVTGASDDTWQLKWHHHGHVNEWNNPDSPFWLDEGDPNNDEQGAPIQSPCAQNSTAPDRVIMLAIDWDMLTEAEWLTALNKLIETTKLKRPSAKRIELMPLIRCPDNQMCNPNADYGEGAGFVAGRQDCYILPEQDAAMAQALASHADIAAAGPVLEATMCNPSHDGAHLTGDDNEIVAQSMADYAAAHP
jgi:hypothetical protein